MAFCPECGKSATAEGGKCVHCGFDLGTKSKPEKARFKGTMIMSAPVQKDAAPPATPAAPAAPAAVPAAPPPAAETPTPAGSAVPKPGLKATMVGANIAVPPMAGMVGAAEDVKKKMAFAATQPLQAFVPPSAPARAEPAKTEPAKAEPAKAEVVASDKSVMEPSASGEKKYLPGDPMAPTPAARPRSQSRHVASLEARAERNPMFLVWLSIAGMLLIGAIGFGAAWYMGLL